MLKNSKIILVLAFLLSLAGCNDCEKELNENVGLNFKEGQSDDSRKADELIVYNSEIFLVFEQFKIETNARLVENTRNLKNISDSYISEKNAVNLAFQGELFLLNKKNSELRSRINNSLVNLNNPVKGDFKDFSIELDLLESNIENLRVRNL
ncbi:MAG: hypothetical protein EA341_01470 [Mongoliibacter sp.]|uniref:hypothetical protein n=1 Tax=Mongoliibacter sp. TaxID=2022438 RepID=UPI0012F19517|nr:hypothetical protein [Mongoliibacter sp.]TVP53168.1 MAG: hypothetical protein EA341_01470 [Mongoliibacter sp.]